MLSHLHFFFLLPLFLSCIFIFGNELIHSKADSFGPTYLALNDNMYRYIFTSDRNG